MVLNRKVLLLNASYEPMNLVTAPKGKAAESSGITAGISLTTTERRPNRAY
jgi:hypothetical protein